MSYRLLLAAPLLALMPACVLPGSSPWNGLHASAYGGYFPVSGDFSSSTTSVESNGAVEFDGGLDLGDDQGTAALLGARFGFAPIEVAISSFGYEGDHSGQVTGATVFQGTSLGGPTDFGVDAQMDLSVTQATLGFDIVNLPPGRVGLLLGIDYLDFDSFHLTLAESVGGLAAGTRQDILTNEAVPLPVIGVRGDVWLPFDMRLGGTVAGASIKHQDVDYEMLDIDLALHWEPGLHTELVLGYRLLETSLDGEVDGTTVDAEIGFDGPYLAVLLYF